MERRLISGNREVVKDTLILVVIASILNANVFLFEEISFYQSLTLFGMLDAFSFLLGLAIFNTPLIYEDGIQRRFLGIKGEFISFDEIDEIQKEKHLVATYENEPDLFDIVFYRGGKEIASISDNEDEFIKELFEANPSLKKKYREVI